MTNTTTDLRTILEAKIGKAKIVSPYRMSVILTEVLQKKVHGPMMYNYMNEKYGFPAVKNDLDKWTVTREDALTFMVKFVEKRTTK